MRIYLIILLLTTCCGTTWCQGQKANVVQQGVIDFEKSINMHAHIKKIIGGSSNENYTKQFDEFKRYQKQFVTVNSKLLFSNSQTLYMPSQNTTEISGHFFYAVIPAIKQINTIYQDFPNGRVVTQKECFGKKYLISDAKRKIKWKITSEMKEIAGYMCRRANGLMNDSIYLVAFYTNQIPIQGGPEMFSGLPGMILGISLPHENITWYAKQVLPLQPSLPIAAPVGGTPISEDELKAYIKQTLKNTTDPGGLMYKSMVL